MKVSERLPLFRPEVAEFQSSQSLGSIVLFTGPAQWAIALGGLIFTMIAILTLLYGRYTHHERVSGRLAPDLGLTVIASPVSGRVLRKLVREGQEVGQDEVLIELTMDLDSPQIGDTQKAISASMREQKSALLGEIESEKAMAARRDDDLRKSGDSIASQLRELDGQVELVEKQIQGNEVMLKKLRQAAEKGFITGVQIQQQENVILQAESEKKVLKRTRLSLLQEAASVEQQKRDSPSKLMSRMSEINGEISQINQALAQNESRRSVLLRAPQRGTITFADISAGQSVASGQSLLTILPEGAKLQAELSIPDKILPFVREGDSITIRYTAFPHQEFGEQRGRILRVSRSTAVAHKDGDHQGSMYRAIADIDEQHLKAGQLSHPLQPDMSLEADIRLEQRRLMDWIVKVPADRGQPAEPGQ